MEPKTIKIIAPHAVVTDFDGNDYYIDKFDAVIAGNDFSIHASKKKSLGRALKLFMFDVIEKTQSLTRSVRPVNRPDLQPTKHNDLKKIVEDGPLQSANINAGKNIEKNTGPFPTYPNLTRTILYLKGIDVLKPSLLAILADATRFARDGLNMQWSLVCFIHIKQIPDMISGLLDSIEQNESESEAIQRIAAEFSNYYKKAIIHFYDHL